MIYNQTSKGMITTFALSNDNRYIVIGAENKYKYFFFKKLKHF